MPRKEDSGASASMSRVASCSILRPFLIRDALLRGMRSRRDLPPRPGDGVLRIGKARQRARLTKNADFEEGREPFDFCARRAKTGERMGEKRDDVFAGKPARAAGGDKPRENSISARAQRLARRIFDREAEAAEFRGDTARQRAVGRDKRRRLARLFQEFAHADGERQGFFALVRRVDEGDIRKRRCEIGGADAAAIERPMIRCFRRTQRFGDEAPACRAGLIELREFDHLVARHFESRQKPRKRRLRMAEGGIQAAIAMSCDLPPRLFVEIAIEPRQNDGASRRARDRRKQARRRAVGAGRADRDHGARHRSPLRSARSAFRRAARAGMRHRRDGFRQESAGQLVIAMARKSKVIRQ